MTARGLAVVFFGTPQFAVPTLDALLASAHRVVGVVTQPDRPRGRGHRSSYAPVKARAIEAGVPVLQPATFRDPAAVEALRQLGADIGVVAAYGRILSSTVLEVPPRGMVNVHASLLPKYRGAAPVHRAVMAGESLTGITIMRVVRELDAGGMLAMAERPIGPDETSEQVERDLSEIGAALLVQTLDRMLAGHVTETPQDDRLATYAHRITRDDGIVDWSRPARTIHNQVRGLYPWPHAFSFLDGQRLIILQSSVSTGTEGSHAGRSAPGTIVEARGDELRVATGDGALRIEELQAEGRRPARTREFLAGHHLAVGARFVGQ
ncbi:MAG: methionyl-tRNA formyltransferase [Vicinamibacterales bacterium]